jgi:HEAT repeat protein
MRTGSTIDNTDMKNGILIPMERSRRLLEKARSYVADMERFLADTSVAVTVLLDALPFADTELRLKILPLLGYAGRDRVLWPLYRLMRASSEDERVRSSAAVQLGLAASLSHDPTVLAEELIANLDHAEPQVRSSCALALGWEGNWPALKSLMPLLADPDREVQAAAVTALSSVGDRRVFDLLIDRLESGTMEEQRSILLNLWRFSEQVPHVADAYFGCMHKIPPDLRADALDGLAMVPVSSTLLHGYRRLLMDEDAGIRRQVLRNLAALKPVDYAPLKDTLRLMLTDSDGRVRQAATRLLAAI